MAASQRASLAGFWGRALGRLGAARVATPQRWRNPRALHGAATRWDESGREPSESANALDISNTYGCNVIVKDSGADWIPWNFWYSP
jgi:hypothetical protein